MRTGPSFNTPDNERAVANMMEYLMISGVIMVLLVVMLLLVNTNIMESPANRLVYVAFTDIGNGVSTRIVDVYAIAPTEGDITTRFDIPDEIVDRDYFVEVGGEGVDQDITVSRGSLKSQISLAGIGASRKATGSTTGAGINKISYNWSGY